jgi:hypothetical protein
LLRLDAEGAHQLSNQLRSLGKFRGGQHINTPMANLLLSISTKPVPTPEKIGDST